MVNETAQREYEEGRTGTFLSFFATLFLILTGRFLYLQITGEANGEPLAAEAAKQHMKTEKIEAKRGSILDQKR